MPMTPLQRALAALSLAGPALFAAGCATWPAEPNAADEVPVALQPAGRVREAGTLGAVGVQVYACRKHAAGGQPAWAFVAPEAELFDAAHRRVGRHGAGPFWALDDGSRIEGTVLTRADAPRPGAIPWLLLATRSSGAAGRLSAVSHVQRIHTEGGAAPAAGCDEASLGREARVPYRADYRLFTPLATPTLSRKYPHETDSDLGPHLRGSLVRLVCPECAG